MHLWHPHSKCLLRDRTPCYHSRQERFLIQPRLVRICPSNKSTIQLIKLFNRIDLLGSKREKNKGDHTSFDGSYFKEPQQAWSPEWTTAFKSLLLPTQQVEVAGEYKVPNVKQTSNKVNEVASY